MGLCIGSLYAPSTRSLSYEGKSRYSEIESESVSGQILETGDMRVFSFVELKAATKNFRSDALLGEGGFGKVYKGWLHHNTLTPAKPGSGFIVAIKKMNTESDQGFQEWKSEVNFLGRISHPNLVKLLGYCMEDEELLLVYEFMQKGSLDSHLFRKHANTEPLCWNTRLKIAIDAARGLAFLHTSEKQVIYRDFKASNILLDGNYNAKISDFGIVKLGPSGGDSHVTPRVIGTIGYVAPEYMATGHLYVKSDVYGFGVVLLEIMTGLRAIDTMRPKMQQNLVEWIRPFLYEKRDIKSIMDAKLEGQYSIKAAIQVAQLTLKCIENDPKNRPSMQDVLHTLECVEAINVETKKSKKLRPRSEAFQHLQQPLYHHSAPM